MPPGGKGFAERCTKVLRVDDRRVLERAAALGIDYVESVPDRPVRPSASIAELRTVLDVALPEGPIDALRVIEDLARDVDPGLAQMGSGRYFGFVIGGSLPVALAAWAPTVAGLLIALALLLHLEDG